MVGLYSVKTATFLVLFLAAPLALAAGPVGINTADCPAYFDAPSKLVDKEFIDKELALYVKGLPLYSNVSVKPDPNLPCIKFLLLHANADPQQIIKLEMYAFDKGALIHKVAAHGDLELLKLFVSKGALSKSRTIEQTETTLMSAINGGAPKQVLEYLVEQGVDVDATGNDGVTPLRSAIIMGDKDAVESLIGKGADYKTPMRNGLTSVHVAAMGPNPAILKYLVLDKKLDVRAKEKDGITPLHYAAQFVHPKNIAFLLSQKADPNARSTFDTTPLHKLAMAPRSRDRDIAQDIECAKMLFEAGADINAQDKDGETPLFLEVAYGSKHERRFLKYLLEHGADPTIQQAQGVTAREFAKRSGDDGLAGILEHYERLWKIRGLYAKWIAEKPKSSLLSKDNYELVRDSMIIDFMKGVPGTPPKEAPEELRAIYNSLKAAKVAPLTVKTEALEIKGLPLSYYRSILKAGRTQSGKAANKFKPTPELARQVVGTILQDIESSVEDHESGAWLLGVAHVPVDTKLLDLFSIPIEQLRKDVEAMLASDASKYDGIPNLAAIKLTKALLAYSDSDLGCAGPGNKKSYLKNPKAEGVIEWLSQVGNLGTADKLLFARLARLVLEEKPNLCPAARNELIKAMRDWRVKDARVQAELACATAYVIGEGGLEKKEYTDILLIASAVGFQNDLSQSAAIEQVCSLGKMTNEPGNDLYRETYLGLVRYVAGNPKGGFEMSKKDDGTIKKIPIDATAPRKDAVVKLCKIAAVYTDKKDLSAEEKCFTESFPLFLNSLKADLDKPRAWPARFLVDDVNESHQNIRGALSEKLKDDIQAIESACASVSKKADKKLSLSKKKPTKGDFKP